MPNFEVLDSKIASVPEEVRGFQEGTLHGRAKKGTTQQSILEAKTNRFTISDYFKISRKSKALFDFNDLLTVQLKNDNAQRVDTNWTRYFSP